MMMPKQKPVNPAPPMAPSCAPVKPKSAAQLARMPPRMPKPMPAARMARKPAHSKRLAFDAIGSLLTDRLLMAILVGSGIHHQARRRLEPACALYRMRGIRSTCRGGQGLQAAPATAEAARLSKAGLFGRDSDGRVAIVDAALEER